MRPREVAIQSFAALTPEGLSSPAGTLPWAGEQSGPADVQRQQVYPKPLPSFGKLSLPDRLAFAAASLAIQHSPAPLPEQTGVSMALAQGSLSTDLRYCESVAAGTPSPAWFSATLPSSSVSEIVIQHKLKGPNRVYAAGDSLDWLWALDDGLRMVAEGFAEAAVVVLVDALEGQDRSSPLVPRALAEVPNRALALLLVPWTPQLPGRRLRIDISDPTTGNTQATEYFSALRAALDAACTASFHYQTPVCRAAIDLHRN